MEMGMNNWEHVEGFFRVVGTGVRRISGVAEDLVFGDFIVFGAS